MRERTSRLFSVRVPPELIDHLVAQVADRLTATIAPPSKPYLNVEQAADYLACGKRRIYDLVERDAIAFYRDGKRLLFRREDLDAYVSAPTASQVHQ